MKNLFLTPSLLLVGLGLCCSIQAQNIYQLQPLSGFGSHTDGSIRPGDTLTFNLSNNALFDNASNERGMAYDPVLTNLVIVDTHTGGGGSDHGVGAIYVLNAQNGLNLDNGSGGAF